MRMSARMTDVLLPQDARILLSFAMTAATAPWITAIQSLVAAPPSTAMTVILALPTSVLAFPVSIRLWQTAIIPALVWTATIPTHARLTGAATDNALMLRLPAMTVMPAPLTIAFLQAVAFTLQ